MLRLCQCTASANVVSAEKTNTYTYDPTLSTVQDHGHNTDQNSSDVAFVCSREEDFDSFEEGTGERGCDEGGGGVRNVG
jgi:hypothetical protein